MPPRETGEPAALPLFKYYPDPVATAVIKPQPDTPCLGCNRIRGWIYTGPCYTEKNFVLDDHLCPWCIADGTAAQKFSVTFNDAGIMQGVTPVIMEEIEQRTPGFNAWQENYWLACCRDGAAFLGVVGTTEIRQGYPHAMPAVRKYVQDEYHLSGKGLQEFLDSLSKDGQPTAYLFQCLHCKQYLTYVDQT